ncbi:hypothetical protein FEM48_Zijuj07G0017800 [Ziziphus jujuba var. spinosa]|uniref:Disease resistance protein At4g27190-like leucine-rich repeats domain-containing protein n=1 Tax=Ziziphus jujuba var. spinosa TaxID=714518 RepID=A0A978V1R2_ZIZJJ|nr:hypothetical protein FEM48_Zijuj07G0017800 [Ziziphus jujuba var. spinosa]
MDQIKRIADCIVTIAECPLKPIIHQVCYVVQYKSNIEDLQTRVDKLNSLTGRVQHSVDKGERTNEKAEDDVKKWIENVGKVIEKANKFSEEANEFVEEEHQANKKCLHGFCANLKPRHQLGRKSTKIKEEVVKLHTEGEKYTTQAVSYPPPLQETWNTSTTSEAFQSRKKEKGDEIFIRQDMDPTEFCQLQFLTLRNLPQFIGFSSIGGRVDEIHNNSAPLFNRKVNNILFLIKILINYITFWMVQLKFPKSLEELKMEGLDRITSIWPDYDSKLIKLSATYKQLNSCRNLRIIRVDGCGSLKYVFPASAARGLEQLVELNVTNCRSIKEIIAKEEGDDDADEIIKFVFPKVKKLRLRYLPQLGNFYPGMHTSKWPSLTSMEINKCKKVETLASDISTFHHQHDQTTTNPNPLFFIEKGSFPKLESLEVTAEEYLCDPLLTHAESFPRLKEVNLFCMHVKSAVFPFASLLKLPALQDLKLQSAFFKEIFMVEQASGLVNGGLTNLGLWRLPELMRLWDENLLALQHQVAAHLVFPNMENLWVKECRRLKDVVQFAISFPNLKALELYECDELNYLFTYSVATSLTKLESLVIKYCKRMTEIISVPSTSNGDDDEYDQTITFGRLELLELHDLPCLAGFCSGNSINVKVPFLQHLKVTNCGLEMKISPDEILVINDSKSAERSLHIAEEEEEDEEDDDYIVYESI